ncbi:MAG: glutamine synthetase family protein [Gemmobacter sp.]
MTLSNLLDQNGCRFATVAMTDTHGSLRGQLVSRRSLDGILRAGMGMAPVTLALDPTDQILNLPGVTDESADFHDSPLIVDEATLRRIPWAKPGHDLLLLSNYAPPAADLCPRSILRRVLDRAEAAGFTAKYGLELEYTLFDETADSARAKNWRGLRTATPQASHDLVLYQTVQSEWYQSVAEMAEPLRIDLAKMHEEIGGGFMEACIAAGTGLEPADQAVLLKCFLRALAMRQGRMVTFMPRWSDEADSQSTHVHVSLLDRDGRPVFHDPAGRHGMSATFRAFIGGLQRHLGELSLIFLPTANAYRRFAPGTFAPPGLTWGYENRTTCLRVVGHDAPSLRVENRLPGSDANPYLTVAATLAAGLAGIESGLEPDDEILGNGYAQGTPPRDFARDMGSAIARLRASGHARDWFGQGFVEGFAATRESQMQALAAKVPDTELARFFELG